MKRIKHSTLAKIKRGFTLVELVIVIAVIAILAAVLIPTFITVIDSANNSADVQLVANMNSVFVTDIDADSTATAENLRKLLKDNGITDFETKKSDNIIVYDQAANRFKLVNLSNAEVISEVDAVSGAGAASLAKTSLADTEVVSTEDRLVVAANPFSPDEIFKGYTVVSTGGNSFAEGINMFHHIVSSNTLAEAMTKIIDANIKNSEEIKTSFEAMIGYGGVTASFLNSDITLGKVAFAYQTTSGTLQTQMFLLKKKATPSGTGGSKYYNGVSQKSDFTSVDKIFVNEDITSLDLSAFSGKGAVVVLPNSIEEITIGEGSFDLSKTLFVGNVAVLHKYAEEKIANNPSPDPENPKTESDVLYGAQVGAKSINEIKEAVTEFGTLIHETEFYLVNEQDSHKGTEHYYTEIGEALKAVGNSAKYSGQPRDLIVASNYTISQNIEIPSGVTLQIPFRYENNKFYTGYGCGYTGTHNGTVLGYNAYINNKNIPHYKFSSEQYLADGNESKNKQYDLTLSQGCTITVQNGGGICVGGVLSNYQRVGVGGKAVLAGYQGHTSGYYGQITNNGQIVLKSGSELDVSGFIKGTGSVIAESGSMVTEPLVMTDFHSVYDGMYFIGHGTAPFFGYSVLNIRNITVNCGAVMRVRVTVSPGSSSTYEEHVLIGYDLGDEGGKTDEGLLVMKDRTSSIILEYSYSESKTAQTNAAIKDSNTANLHGDIGTTKMTFKGTVDTGSIVIFNIINTTSALFPIPYNFKYEIQGQFNVHNKFVVLPGAEVTVQNSGQLNITNNSEFYVLSYMEQGDVIGGSMVGSAYQQGCKYPTAQQLTTAGYSSSGVLTVNGIMTIESTATVGGIVRSNAANAKLDIKAGATVSKEFSIGGTAFSGCNTFTCTLALQLMQNEAITDVQAGKNYVSTNTQKTANVSVAYQYAKPDESGDITLEELKKTDELLKQFGDSWACWPHEKYKITNGSAQISVQSNSWNEAE